MTQNINLLKPAIEEFVEKKLYHKAVPLLQQVMQVEGESLPVCYGLAFCYFHLNEKQKACTLIKKTLLHVPQHQPSRILLQAIGGSLAKDVLSQLLKVHSEDPVFNRIQGDLCSREGEYFEAFKHYQQSFKITKDALTLINMLGNLPKAVPSLEYQEDLKKVYLKLLSFPEALVKPKDYFWPQELYPGFQIAYYTYTTKPFYVALYNFIRKVMPHLEYQTPHVSKRGKKIKLGIVTEKAFIKGDVVERLLGELFKNLSREEFDLHFFDLGVEDKPRETYPEKIQMLRSLADIRKVHQHIAEQRLDILFYPDLHMTNLTYCLAFSRLAPIQVTGCGHPVTSGIDTIDYFISSKLMETPASKEHFTEKLVLIDSMVGAYEKWEVPGKKVSLEAYGVPRESHKYLCLQNIIKFSPDFDPLLKEILEKDEKGALILPDFLGTDGKMLKARLKNILGDHYERVYYVPKCGHDVYLGFLQQGDVGLDTLVWGAGTTAYESFAMSLPLVTLPGLTGRARAAYALYQQMGIHDLIAQSKEDYVKKAVQVATDKTYAKSLRKRIEEESPKIFSQNITPEYERVFREMVEKSHG